MKPLENAQLHWYDNGTPASSQFDDVYFSKHDGCAESEYVFLKHNQLAERFSSLEKNHFVIGETGFGTGLNFLNAWQLWRKHAKSHQKLFFISAELHPIEKSDLARCLAAWPPFSELSERLLQHYPPAIQGMHYLELDANTCLILLFDDVLKGFTQLLENQHPNHVFAPSRCMDTWFLDGFSPAKNEAMWRDELFQVMGKLSHRETTLATFTSAGFVKRGLQAAGFQLQKGKGFGHKREMLFGQYQGLPHTTIDNERNQQDYGAFWPVYRHERPIKSVIVIGAGIAGCTTARALAQAGLDVILLERHEMPMQEASGNPQAVLFPKLSTDEKAFTAFNLQSLLYAWRYYREQGLTDCFHACGLLDLISANDTEKATQIAEHFAAIVQKLSAEEASSIANTTLTNDALYYRQTGFIDTQQLAKYFANEKNYRFIGGSDVTAIERQQNLWHVATETQVFTADAVVLCNAQAANSLLNEPLPTRTIRGQITGFTDPKAQNIHCVICQHAYICPAQNNRYHCGASFDLHNHEKSISLASQQQNLTALHDYLQDFSHIAHHDVVNNRVNFRCCAPDYLPVTGPVPYQQQFLLDYAKYRKNARATIAIPGSYIPGLFINIAMGSRGFSSAPLCAALISAYLTGQPYPLPFDLVSALNPARFVIRQLIQNK